MKIFKDILCQINTTLGAAILGNTIGRVVFKDYKTSTILLFIVAALFIVSYFIERYSKYKY